MKVMGPVPGETWGSQSQESWEGWPSPWWGVPAPQLGSLQGGVGTLRAGGGHSARPGGNKPRLSLLLLPVQSIPQGACCIFALCVPECTKAKRFLQSPLLQPQPPQTPPGARNSPGGREIPIVEDEGEAPGVGGAAGWCQQRTGMSPGKLGWVWTTHTNAASSPGCRVDALTPKAVRGGFGRCFLLNIGAGD